MNSRFRIFFNEKRYFIFPGTDRPVADKAGSLVLDNPDADAITASIADLDNNRVSEVTVYSERVEETFELFASNFKKMQAGGGLVTNEKGEYLFIFRRGKWDLPKGKLDEGETIAECALREVKEETGLKEVKLLDHLCNTYHVYHESGRFILKESVWYKMECASHEDLKPQTEEDITEIKWLPIDEWPGVSGNTFASIVDVLEREQMILRG